MRRKDSDGSRVIDIDYNVLHLEVKQRLSCVSEASGLCGADQSTKMPREFELNRDRWQMTCVEVVGINDSDDA